MAPCSVVTNAMKQEQQGVLMAMGAMAMPLTTLPWPMPPTAMRMTETKRAQRHRLLPAGARPFGTPQSIHALDR